MNETKISHEWHGAGYPGVAIHNDIIAATSNMNKGTMLYKRQGEEWKEYALLKGERRKDGNDWFKVARMDQNLVFTSRYNYGGRFGAVFVHDLAQEE